MAAFNDSASALSRARNSQPIEIYYHPELTPRPPRSGVFLRPARVPGSVFPPHMPAAGVSAVYATDWGSGCRPPLTTDDVIAVTTCYYGLSRAALVGSSAVTRRATDDALVPFRYVALILAMRLTAATAQTIATAIGRRDSTSVYMAYRNIKAKRRANERWQEDILLLTTILSDFFDVTPSGRLGV